MKNSIIISGSENTVSDIFYLLPLFNALNVESTFFKNKIVTYKSADDAYNALISLYDNLFIKDVVCYLCLLIGHESVHYLDGVAFLSE